MIRLEIYLMLFLSAIIAIPCNAQNEEDVFYVVDEMPVFPGGEEAMKAYISNNVKYPEEAQVNKVEGKVFISFVVAKDGNIKDAVIERGVAPSLDNESLRVIKSMPKWTSGKQKGKLVNVKFTVPINFKLDSEKSNAKAIENEGVMIFRVVEEMPEFPGGKYALSNYIAKNIKYPEAAKKEGIEGKVFVSFVVTKDGNTKNVTIERGAAPSLDQEALRVISSLPDWKAGKHRGEKVNVQFTIPVIFALNDN